LTSAASDLLAEVTNLLMSLEFANLRYSFIHPVEGNYFYVVALHGTSILKISLLEHWIEVERDFILAIGQRSCTLTATVHIVKCQFFIVLNP